jgi:hypothetical protein
VQAVYVARAPSGFDTGGVVFTTPTTDARDTPMNTNFTSTAPVRSMTCGSHDGIGAGDHDTPYRFGRRPCVSAPYPFSTRQYARLLVLRGRVREKHAKAETAGRNGQER